MLAIGCGTKIRPGGATSELWRIPDGKGKSGLFSYSELTSGSPHLCRLRTDRFTPVSKFDYVLAHVRFMGSLKPSSFCNCLVKL
jgi:hypothetical protein